MTRPAVWLAIAVLLVFAPNLAHFSDAAIGSGASDALKHVWSQWIVHQQTMNGDPLALSTDLIHHPTGGAFFSLDTANAWAGLPLRGWLGSVATYNAITLLNILAAAMASLLLARKLRLGPEAQWLAGFGFALSAWVFCFPLGSGVSETAVFWPLPLIALAAVHTWDSPGWRWPVAGGVLLIVQGFACWSHGITAGLMLGLLGLAHHRQLRSDPERIRRFAAFAGTAVLIALPLYAAISGTVTADDAIKTRTLSLFHSSPLGPLAVPEANSMALADFFLPGSYGRRVSQAGTEQLMYAAYPGWGLLLLAAMAIRRRSPGARLLLGGAVFFALMSMGPRLYIDHARSIGGIPNPVYLAAYWAIPLVNATIHSVDRFAVGVQLCVVLLAAAGLTGLSLKHRRLAVVAIAAEFLLLSPGSWPVPMVKATAHPISEHLRQAPEAGAVIDLPYMSAKGGHTWFNGDVFLQQTIHGRPIPFQLEGHGIETAHPKVSANPYFQALSANRAPEAPCDGVQELSKMGFGWIVLRPGSGDAVLASLQSCMMRVVDKDDRTLFRIPGTP